MHKHHQILVDWVAVRIKANAVRTALIGSGISSSRIATRGYAEAYPVSSNASAEGPQLNRRVEIVLSDENGKNVSR